MKKQLFFIILLAITVSASAQHDTVRYGDSVYMFNPYDTLVSHGPYPFWEYGLIGNILSSNRLPAVLSQAYHTDSSIWIYGVAVTIDNSLHLSIDPALYHGYHYSLIDSLRKENCLMATLHQQDMETGHVTLIDTVGWKLPVLERNFECKSLFLGNGPYYSYGDTVSGVCRSVEFYFDSPWQVHDTFYVGTRALYSGDSKDECYYWVNDPTVGDLPLGNRAYASVSTNSVCKWVTFPNVDIHAQPVSMTYDNWIHGTPYFLLTDYTEGSLWGYVFPILYPRMDGCKAPAKPWFVDRTNASATFEWEQAHDVVEVVVNRDYNGMPDTMPGAVTIPAGSTGYTATGLEPNTYYGIWVRRQCHWITPTFDTVVWSPWTHVQLFSTAPEGIDPRLDPTPFEVSPNPAHASFRVATNALPARLALFDIRGTELYATDLHAQSVNIGVADLPAGVYFVTLTSTSGTSTRRLVLQ